MFDGDNLFDYPVKTNMRTYDNIQKTITSQGEDYTTGCLLDCPYFNEQYRIIAIYLSNQEAIDADPKVI